MTLKIWTDKDLDNVLQNNWDSVQVSFIAVQVNKVVDSQL